MCTQHQELDNSFSKSLFTNAPNTTTQLQCPPMVLKFELIPETRKTTKKQRENTHNLARSTYQINVDFAGMHFYPSSFFNASLLLQFLRDIYAFSPYVPLLLCSPSLFFWVCCVHACEIVVLSLLMRVRDWERVFESNDCVCQRIDWIKMKVSVYRV